MGADSSNRRLHQPFAVAMHTAQGLLAKTPRAGGKLDPAVEVAAGQDFALAKADTARGHSCAHAQMAAPFYRIDFGLALIMRAGACIPLMSHTAPCPLIRAKAGIL